MDILKQRSEITHRAILAGGFAGALLLAGCSGNENISASSAETTSAATTAATSSSQAPAMGTTEQSGITVTFDDLGGGYPDINVYQGVGDSSEDRTVSGTYLDGDTVAAACVMEGRPVASDTSVGELERSSNQWILLSNTNVRQFATAVYIENPEEVIAQLPPCSE